MNSTAAVAASPASFQPLKAANEDRRAQIRAALSIGDRTCPSTAYPPVRAWTQHCRVAATAQDRRRWPSCAPGDELRRRVRLHAQGPPDRALGLALPGAGAARPHRRDPRARVPRRGLPGRPVRAGRPGRVQGRAERFRDELQSTCDSIERADPAGVDPARLPAGGLPRPRGARRLPGAPRRARSTTAGLRGLLDAFLDDAALPRRAAAGRRARAAATTPTSAA